MKASALGRKDRASQVNDHRGRDASDPFPSSSEKRHCLHGRPHHKNAGTRIVSAARSGATRSQTPSLTAVRIVIGSSMNFESGIIQGSRHGSLHSAYRSVVPEISGLERCDLNFITTRQKRGERDTRQYSIDVMTIVPGSYLTTLPIQHPCRPHRSPSPESP